MSPNLQRERMCEHHFTERKEKKDKGFRRAVVRLVLSHGKMNDVRLNKLAKTDILFMQVQ